MPHPSRKQSPESTVSRPVVRIAGLLLGVFFITLWISLVSCAGEATVDTSNGSSEKTIVSDFKPIPLPARNGSIDVPAQEWPLRPGPRTVKVTIHYPRGQKANINSKTGLMLTLHNWGGTGCAGTANPNELANRLNVVALCVDYLQSGPKDSIEGPEPYDFGYLQGLDALRSLHAVFASLKAEKIPFHEGRIYATGGSGGGNVTLMAHKLAPRTFSVIIDMCGMPRLSDDIAFNLPGKSGLDARYKQDAAHPYFLSKDEQDIRYVGHPGHLTALKKLGGKTKVIVVHGVEDTTCPYDDAVEMVANMKGAGLDVEAIWVDRQMLDGKVFLSPGHSLGNRTEIVFKTAGKYLLPDSEAAIIRQGPTDFERTDSPVVYETPRGRFRISYAQGYPVGTFEKK